MAIFYEDGGHGWLRIPLKEIKELGIEKDITGYSYVDKEFVYLEEDQDAGTYLNKKFHDPYSKQTFIQNCENIYHENIWIRNLNHYKASK